MDARFEWTEATIELAVSMWNEGKPAGEIAATLGTTRNSVIGKMHRTSKVRDDIKKYDNPVPKKAPVEGVKPTAAKKPSEKPKVVFKQQVDAAEFDEPVAVIEKPVIETEEPEEVNLPWHPAPLFKQEQPVFKAEGVSFLDVKSCQCRWPLWGDDSHIAIEDKRFCGKRTETVTMSWCSEHAARMFVPARR